MFLFAQYGKTVVVVEEREGGQKVFISSVVK